MPSPAAIKFSEPLKSISLRSVGMASSAAAQDDQAAYQRGLADGERRLSQQLLQQRSEMTELQNGLLENLRKAADGAVQSSRQAMIELAVAIAQKAIGDLPITQGLVEQAVENAVGEIDTDLNFVVEIHPEDLRLLKEGDSPLLVPSIDRRNFTFRASSAVGRGGCVIRTESGTVDATREGRFGRIMEAVLS